MSPVKIFLTGATGYIGGAVLGRLIAHPEFSSFEISILVRDPIKAKRFEADFGLRPVIGSLDDLQLIEDEASRVDVYINTADADHYNATKAILAGLKRRYTTTGQTPTLIHTSGIGVLTEYTDGMRLSDNVYSDLDIEKIESLPDSAMHRNVDLEVVAADQEGYVRTHIVLPGIVYDIAQGPIFKAGLANPHTILIPWLIKACLDRGRAGIVGEGKGVWASIHTDEMADLYIRLFDVTRREPEKAAHGREGFYFGENGEIGWYQLAAAIGEALVAVGKTADPTPTMFSDEECQKYFNGKLFGSNSRCRAERARALGWKLKHVAGGLLTSIRSEVDAIIAKTSEDRDGMWAASIQRING